MTKGNTPVVGFAAHPDFIAAIDAAAAARGLNRTDYVRRHIITHVREDGFLPPGLPITLQAARVQRDRAARQH